MKKKKNVELDIIKQSRAADRAERISLGIYMGRPSVHNKKSRQEKRLDARYRDAVS